MNPYDRYMNHEGKVVGLYTATNIIELIIIPASLQFLNNILFKNPRKTTSYMPYYS